MVDYWEFYTEGILPKIVNFVKRIVDGTCLTKCKKPDFDRKGLHSSSVSAVGLCTTWKVSGPL